MEIKPALATSWQQVDPTTIDFTLRQGVTFQNGDPFTADDVVYTINTIIHDKRVAIPAYYTSFAGAEKLDDFHVRIKLTGVSPAVMEYLAMVTPILAKGLSRESRRRCLLPRADRHRPLQDHQGRWHHPNRHGAI